MDGIVFILLTLIYGMSLTIMGLHFGFVLNNYWAGIGFLIAGKLALILTITIMKAKRES